MKTRVYAILAIPLLTVLASMYGHVPALALDPPGEREVAASLAAELPAYWSVRSVEITSSVNDGDEVSPRYRQQFVADTLPREDLYLPLAGDGEIGPFTMLITTNPATEPRRFYGTATSVVALGKWSTELDVENSVLGVGLPRSLFGGPVIVAGAERTDQIAERFLKLAELSKMITEGVVRSKVSVAALEKLAAEERAALDEANRQRLAALKERYEQERVRAAAAAEGERQQVEAANRVRLAALKAELEEETAELARRKTAVNQARKLFVEDSRRILDELGQKYRKERAALAAAAERERQRMEASNRDRLAALKAELDQETAKVDDMTAALVKERRLLNETNQAMLNALQAQYKRKREEVTAVAETLDAIAKAEAEAEGQKKLAVALAALAEEKKRVADSTEKSRAAELAKRKTRYDALVA